MRFDDQRGGRGGESEFEHKVDHDVMFRAWAACRMQAWWRMVATRWRYRYNQYTMYHIAASVVQRVWRKRLHYLREAGLIKLHARRASMRQSSEQSSEHHRHDQQQIARSLSRSRFEFGAARSLSYGFEFPFRRRI